MALPSVEQSIHHLYSMPKKGKAEKRCKRSSQKHTATKKTLLLDEISETLTRQLDPPKDIVDISSVSISSASSYTLHDAIQGEERVPQIKSAGLLHQRHSVSSRGKQPISRPTSQSTRQAPANTFTLDDVAAVGAIERLATRYGRVSHMGVLDPRYKFFVNKARTAALSFKVHNKVALVMGDPLCEPDWFTNVLTEFKAYRRRFGWSIAFIGASEVFAEYAKEHRWTTMQFGTERVLNPMTNDVLNERGGKRIIVQSKQLLNPSKGNVSLGLYIPAQGEDLDVQRELVGVYDSWREERNRAAGAKAFITVYDPFSMPGMMVYIYTRGPDGVANGFAALRHLGANQGYHIDPCIAAPGAPRGITDLLIVAAMALLHSMRVSYLSLGFEPLEALADITRLSPPIEKITRAIYKRTFRQMLFKGKQMFHEKFKPDGSQGSPLYILFPAGAPSPRQLVAVSRMSNISIRKLVFPRSEKNSETVKSVKQQLEEQRPGSDVGSSKVR
ncbi:uncharacterized protein CDV56_105096 [Aspergillus thermomutatus]|uniref:Phosphatidylglycerol lysyltransferase C-terminal domain-containing protein n=1 Tax=Aspergillus thermomutatus TaxID=41047 RepID=A0A397HLB3_ASPTH|nr:uncharacterized protein CDV56_105096 [Aspergillus thermomutatus]RHZ63889.1 hypothetical protein CDV56_105096 [Aspergillus thermomutatus]